MAGGLYPTKTRLALLRQVANNQVMVDLTTEDGEFRVVLFPNAPDEYQTQQTVTARIDEMESEGWIRVDRAGVYYLLTDAGCRILEEAGAGDG